MTKEQIIDLLMLMSALEAWSFTAEKMLPDYLHDQLCNNMDALRKYLLDESEVAE